MNNITFFNNTLNINTVTDPINSIFWDTYVSDFCEGKIYGHPEILNCLSCFFLSYFPYISLKYSYIESVFIHNILSLLFITGFTSFGYHWTGYLIFKYLDEIPMTISIWLGLYNINHISLNNRHIFHIINFYFILMLSINSIPSLNFIFPYLFFISCICLVPFICYYYYGIHYNSYFKQEMKISINLCKKGMIIAIGSGFFWFLIEKLCNIFFIFGHALWHIGISIGMYYILVALEYHQLIITKKHTKYSYEILYIHKYIPFIKHSDVHVI